MLVDYPDTMTVREARKRYFEVNGFGETGGYEDAWVDFKLGPLLMPFPNTKSRVEAVGYHDVHHVLTGYDTNTIGEFEIAAWELAAGCKNMVAAWVLNLGGVAAGLFLSPRRCWSAFVRGRKHRTTYGAEMEKLLDMKVGEARRRFTPDTKIEATTADAALFAVTAVIALATGAVLWPLIPFVVPVGLVSYVLRRRAQRPATG